MSISNRTGNYKELEELQEMLEEAEADVENLKKTIFNIKVSQAYATIYRAAYKLELTGDS